MEGEFSRMQSTVLSLPPIRQPLIQSKKKRKGGPSENNNSSTTLIAPSDGSTEDEYVNKTETFQTTIQIDKAAIGAVIGKNGSQARKIGLNHNVRVDVETKKTSKDGKAPVTIFGSTTDDIRRAATEVNNTVADYFRKKADENRANESKLSIETPRSKTPERESNQCRFYRNGYCHFGDQCRNMHELNTSTPSNTRRIRSWASARADDDYNAEDESAYDHYGDSFNNTPSTYKK